MVAPLAVVAPGPVLVGLFAGPGIAVHILAKRIFAHIEKEPAQLLLLSAFSAAVSGAIAFALIESTLVVAAVAIVTFSVIIAYELAHPKTEVPSASLNKDAVTAAVQKVVADQVLPKFTALERAVGAIQVPSSLTEAQLAAALREIPKGATQAEVRAAICAIPKEVTKVELTAALGKLPKGATLREIQEHITTLPKSGPDTELRAQIEALSEQLEALRDQLAQTPPQYPEESVRPDALAELHPSEDVVLQKLEAVRSAGEKICAQQSGMKKEFAALNGYLTQIMEGDAKREEALQEALAKGNSKVELKALEMQIANLANALSRMEGILIGLQQRPAPVERSASAMDLSMMSLLQQQVTQPRHEQSHFGRTHSFDDRNLRGEESVLSTPREPRRTNSAASLRREDLDKTLRESDRSAQGKSPLARSGSSAFSEYVSPKASPVVAQRALSPKPVVKTLPARGYLVAQGSLDAGELKLARESFQDVHPKEDMKPKDFKRQAAMKARLGLAFRPAIFDTYQAEVVAEAIRDGRVDVNAPVVLVPGGSLSKGINAYRTLLGDHTLERGQYVVESWFMCAAIGNHPALMDYLAKEGANTNLVTTSPSNPRHPGRLAANFAARFGACDALQWFVDHGGLETFGGPGGKVPVLFDAACSQSPDALSLVLSHVDKASANILVSSLLEDDAAQVWRCENTSCNAFHVALLRKDQRAAEMLLKCDAIDYAVKTEKTRPQSYGAEMSPLHLLLHFIHEGNLEPEHWMVGLAIQIMQKMNRKQCLEEGNTWYKDRVTTARPLPVKFADIIKKLQKETAEKLRGALPKA